MSMITEQIERMRRLADEMEKSTFVHEATHFIAIKVLREAAETIETLSEKVRAANMERSTAYYNGGWIPVKERLPRDLEPVNITWINHDPEPYYKDIKDKPFTATGVYFNGQWYWWSTLCTDILAEYSHNYDDIIDDAIEVVAWMPLPDAYREDDN